MKMKPANVKSGTYIDFEVENNDNNHKFEVGDYVRISKYKNIFCKRLLFRMVRRSFCD